MPDLFIEITDSLAEIGNTEWNRLAGSNPFVRYEFFQALHTSGCASPRSGWSPRFLLLKQGQTLVGALPLYIKSHSRGEYVFDHSWANAFHQHGLNYYPKLLCAVPFTPVAGPRLLAQTEEHRLLLAQAAIQLAQEQGLSSLHLLFPHESDIPTLRAAGFMLREGVQFHWRNADYGSFDAFLAGMSHDKRKKTRQDRRRVHDSGIRFENLRSDEITEQHLDFFYQCYVNTYDAHHSSPYLTRQFLQLWFDSMPQSLLLTVALRGDTPIASALNVIGDNTLYGRYWGTTEFVSGLHFETCYNQAIEYCINHGIQRFEGGAQGLHKLSRGLLPTPTWSAHWVADPRFSDAIQQFLAQETEQIQHYIEELEEHAPFKAH